MKISVTFKSLENIAFVSVPRVLRSTSQGKSSYFRSDNVLV